MQIDDGSSVDVALAPSGEPANSMVTNFAHSTSLNADGTMVAFISQASNLGSDADDINDVFVWTAAGLEAPPSTTPTPVVTTPAASEPTAPDTTVDVDSTPWVDDPTAITFPAESLLSVDFTEQLGIWPKELGPEAAIHALAPATDGWLAVGSVTPALQPGTAALWRVAADGTFGEPEVLPTLGGSSSVARDLLTVGDTTLVAGYQGAGERAVPVVWRGAVDGAWTYSVLATDPGRVRGAIVDEMFQLTDGTTVVVGRGDGPFHPEVVVWWSTDGGVTWNDFIPAGVRSFLAPLVATDGSRIAMLLSSVPGDDGLAAFNSATIVWDAAGPQLESVQYIDPSPGERYWPRTLLWDGTAFVGGFQTEGSPVFATSVDGRTYEFEDMALPGLSTSLPTNVEAMALVDGALTVLIEQGVEVTAFRREGTDLVPIDIPYVVAGDMAYLEGRELLATDGHRIGYLAANWSSKVFLGWDGATWTTRQVTEVPPHRNLVRDEVREIVTTNESSVALLVRSVSDEPSHFQPGPGGILWQPPGESDWMLPDIYEHIPVAAAVTEWRSSFVIAGLDFETNTTTLWRLDPTLAVFTQMGVIDGRVSELVSGADGLVAEVTGADGPSDSSKSVWRYVRRAQVDRGRPPGIADRSVHRWRPGGGGLDDARRSERHRRPDRRDCWAAESRSARLPNSSHSKSRMGGTRADGAA